MKYAFTGFSFEPKVITFSVGKSDTLRFICALRCLTGAHTKKKKMQMEWRGWVQRVRTIHYRLHHIKKTWNSIYLVCAVVILLHSMFIYFIRFWIVYIFVVVMWYSLFFSLLLLVTGFCSLSIRLSSHFIRFKVNMLKSFCVLFCNLFSLPFGRSNLFYFIYWLWIALATYLVAFDLFNECYQIRS